MGPSAAMMARPPTYEGTASGATQSARHQRAPARSVRSVSQTIGTAISTEAAVTAAARPAVLPSSRSVSVPRTSRQASASAPAARTAR